MACRPLGGHHRCPVRTAEWPSQTGSHFGWNDPPHRSASGGSAGPGASEADAIALIKKRRDHKKEGVPNPYGSHPPGGRAEIALREIFTRVSKVAISRLACYKGLCDGERSSPRRDLMVSLSPPQQRLKRRIEPPMWRGRVRDNHRMEGQWVRQQFRRGSAKTHTR